MDRPLWEPSPGRIERARLTHFRRMAETRWHRTFASYQDLHRFSIEHPEDFWAAFWDLRRHRRARRTIAADLDKMPGARFFPSPLNFAANLLRRRDGEAAIVFVEKIG